jgi:hypothetical protein
MNMLTAICMRIATSLLNAEHSEWARAMRSELEHVPKHERVRWAFGCLAAAIQQRVTSMRRGTLQVAPWVLMLELIFCFLPITFGWFDSVFGMTGVVHLNATVAREFSSNTPLGTWVLAMMIAGAVVGLVGPVGLLWTLGTLTKRVSVRPRFGLAMIAALVAYGVASLGLHFFAGPGAYTANFEFVVLIILLPSAGLAHLMYVTRPNAAVDKWAVSHN